MNACVSRFGELLVRHCGGAVTFAGLLDGGS
jgi:hypothetical protein